MMRLQAAIALSASFSFQQVSALVVRGVSGGVVPAPAHTSAAANTTAARDIPRIPFPPKTRNVSKNLPNRSPCGQGGVSENFIALSAGNRKTGRVGMRHLPDIGADSGAGCPRSVGYGIIDIGIPEPPAVRRRRFRVALCSANISQGPVAAGLVTVTSIFSIVPSRVIK